MSEFVDTAWIVSKLESKKERDQNVVTYLIGSYRDKDSFRHLKDLEENRVYRFLLVSNYPATGPIIEIGLYNGCKSGVHSFSIWPNEQKVLSDIQEVLTIEQDFGKLWVALPYI